MSKPIRSLATAAIGRPKQGIGSIAVFAAIASRASVRQGAHLRPSRTRTCGGSGDQPIPGVGR